MSDITDIITVVLSSTGLTLADSDNVQQISIDVESGTCTIKGSGDWRANPSDVQTLVAGRNVTYTAKGPNAPIVGLVITAVGGITNLSITR
jgi:hypothetical protein